MALTSGQRRALKAFQALPARGRGQFAKGPAQPQGYGTTTGGSGPAPPMAVSAPQASPVPPLPSASGGQVQPGASVPGIPEAVLARYAKFGDATAAFRRRQRRQQIDKGVNLKNPIGDAEIAYLRRHGAL